MTTTSNLVFIFLNPYWLVALCLSSDCNIAKTLILAISNSCCEVFVPFTQQFLPMYLNWENLRLLKLTSSVSLIFL